MGLGKVLKITILKVTARKGKFIKICAYEAIYLINDREQKFNRNLRSKKIVFER